MDQLNETVILKDVMLLPCHEIYICKGKDERMLTLSKK